MELFDAKILTWIKGLKKRVEDQASDDGIEMLHSNRSPARHRDSIVYSLFDLCINDFDDV